MQKITSLEQEFVQVDIDQSKEHNVLLQRLPEEFKNETLTKMIDLSPETSLIWASELGAIYWKLHSAVAYLEADNQASKTTLEETREKISLKFEELKQLSTPPQPTALYRAVSAVVSVFS